MKVALAEEDSARVYKGKIDGQTTVALKRLDPAFGQGDTEFWKEIMMLSLYKHENIVSLLGFCDDSGEKILMYEYVPNKSLDQYLNDDKLGWIGRLKICIGAARGLECLHNADGTQQRVLHRDIKSSNILLDEDWNAKISDFGLSKLGPANQQYTFLISKVVGTPGYVDPVYAETGLLTKESDVYSFGVVLSEVLCGRLCIDNKNDTHPYLIKLAKKSYKQNKIKEIVYDNIRDEIDPDSLHVFATIAYKCLKRDREERPSLSDILRALGTALRYQEVGNDPAANNDFSPERYRSKIFAKIDQDGDNELKERLENESFSLPTRHKENMTEEVMKLFDFKLTRGDLLQAGMTTNLNNYNTGPHARSEDLRLKPMANPVGSSKDPRRFLIVHLIKKL